jgi:Uma2 family endonuclease
MNSYVLDVRNIFELSDEQFYQLCRRHPDIHFERSATGELVIMPPTGGVSGNRNFSLTGQLWAWADRYPDLGVGFDSSTCFKLPNGADRAPDVAWVRADRWDALTPEQQEKFPPIAPDFVIELRSRTDDLKPLQAKMAEYAANGVRLGLLLNPQDRQVEVHRPDRPMELLAAPNSIDCDEVLPGFVLKLDRVM